MQVHANSKAKVALDNITWVNRCTKCRGNKKYHFTFSFDSILCRRGGEFFHLELHSVTPAAFRHNFWPAGLNPNPDLLNPKPIGFDRLSRTTTVPSFKFLRSGVFVLSCNTQTHTYIHIHIVTEWSQYPRHRTTSSVRIIKEIIIIIQTL